MYSKYIDGHFHPLTEYVQQDSHTAARNGHEKTPCAAAAANLGNMLGRTLRQFSMENLDIGDILLVLIILLLLLDGDDLETIITLGLMLLLGLGGNQSTS